LGERKGSRSLYCPEKEAISGLPHSLLVLLILTIVETSPKELYTEI
jgi:hypothetical protein